MAKTAGASKQMPVVFVGGAQQCCATLTARSIAMLQAAGGLLGVVGEDYGGAGGVDDSQDLEDDALLVEPAFGYGGFDHGVFAAYVVGAHGDVEFVAHGSDDVQIRQGRLDHHHIGALFQIEGDFLQGLAGVGGIHLVAAAIAELGRGLRGFAEGAVKAGAVLGGVGKNGDVFKFMLVEFFADGGDAAVHHVGGRNDIGAGASMRQRLVGEDGDSRVIGNVAVLDYTAVAVVGIFAKANVGNGEKFQVCFANGFDGALDNSLRGKRACAARVF